MQISSSLVYYKLGLETLLPFSVSSLMFVTSTVTGISCNTLRSLVSLCHVSTGFAYWPCLDKLCAVSWVFLWACSVSLFWLWSRSCLPAVDCVVPACVAACSALLLSASVSMLRALVTNPMYTSRDIRLLMPRMLQDDGRRSACISLIVEILSWLLMICLRTVSGSVTPVL